MSIDSVEIKRLKKENELLHKENKALKNENTLLIRKKELYYQKHLECLLKGSHYKVQFGIIDIHTDDTIYEIKDWKNFNSVLGQLYSYNNNLDKKLCVCFFGNRPKTVEFNDILSYFKKHNIKVIELNETITLNTLVELDSEKSDIHKLVFENLEIGTDKDYVYLKEIISLLKLHKLYKNKDDVLNIIKELFPDAVFYIRRYLTNIRTNFRSVFFNLKLKEVHLPRLA
jgi:hypothetical protein